MEVARISAVILDLDGTLLDTERATKNVLKDFLEKYGKVPDAEKEEKRLGKMLKESAVSIVEDYELPMTPDEFFEAIIPMYQQRLHQAKALPGANRLIRHLHNHGVPLALASNSIRKHIEMKIVHHQGWKESFNVILGGDEVNHGKPSPDIFLEAAKDWGVGVRAAKASGATVVAIPSLQDQAEHFSIANFMLHSLLEFQPELWGLPAFEDWVQNALPIEPLHVRGLIGEGVPHDGCTVLNIIADNDSFASLPDQVSGVFFGWAKLQIQDIFKMVVIIGWDLSSGIPKRVIQPRLFGHINKYPCKEQFHMLFVGYIRKLRDEADKLETLRLSEEDESVAQAALDLPIFSNHMSNPLLEEADFGDEAFFHGWA